MIEPGCTELTGQGLPWLIGDRSGGHRLSAMGGRPGNPILRRCSDRARYLRVQWRTRKAFGGNTLAKRKSHKEPIGAHWPLSNSYAKRAAHPVNGVGAKCWIVDRSSEGGKFPPALKSRGANHILTLGSPTRMTSGRDRGSGWKGRFRPAWP